MEGTRRITAEKPRPRLFVFFAVIAILITVFTCFERVRPATVLDQEVSDTIGAEALQRARRLYEKLAPGEAQPGLRVAYNTMACPDGPLCQEIIVSSAEEEATARFSAIYNIRTARLRQVTWSSERPWQPRATGLQQPLNHQQAVLVTRHYLRLAGVTEMEGPWTEDVVFRRALVRSHHTVGIVWHVHLTSPHWSVWTVIDALTAEPTQLFLTPGRKRG